MNVFIKMLQYEKIHASERIHINKISTLRECMLCRNRHFKDVGYKIYSGVNGKWYKKSWKEFDRLKNIDQNHYCSNYYDININKYGVKCRTSLRFRENKDLINKIDPYGWFQWYFRYWLGRKSLDDERQINRWKGIGSRFKDKLVKLIKDTGSKFDNYSISPKIEAMN